MFNSFFIWFSTNFIPLSVIFLLLKPIYHNHHHRHHHQNIYGWQKIHIKFLIPLMLSNHLFLITNVIHAESIVDIDTTIYNDLNQESIENNNENSDSNSRSSSPDSSSGHNNDDEQRTSSSSASESLTSTTANDFGIHDDEVSRINEKKIFFFYRTRISYIEMYWNLSHFFRH